MLVESTDEYEPSEDIDTIRNEKSLRPKSAEQLHHQAKSLKTGGTFDSQTSYTQWEANNYGEGQSDHLHEDDYCHTENTTEMSEVQDKTLIQSNGTSKPSVTVTTASVQVKDEVKVETERRTIPPILSSTPRGRAPPKAAYSGDQYRALEDSRDRIEGDLKTLRVQYRTLDSTHKRVSEDLRSAFARLSTLEDEHRQAYRALDSKRKQTMHDLQTALSRCSALEDEHRQALRDIENKQTRFSKLEGEHIQAQESLSSLRVRLAQSVTKSADLDERRSVAETEWRASYEHNVLLRNEVTRLRGTVPPPPAPYATQRLPPTQENLMDAWRDEHQEDGKVKGGRDSVADGRRDEEAGENERAAKRRK